MGMQDIANAILLAGVYGVIGLGFSLVYGVTNIINLSHGSFIMIGALMTYTFHNAFGLNPLISLPIVMAICYVLGYIIQRTLINRTMKISILMTLVLTFGLSLLILNFALWAWGPTFKTITVEGLTGVGIDIGTVVIPMSRLVVFIISLLLTGLLYLFMNNTKTGTAIKAVSLNQSAAISLGISPLNIYAIAYGLGSSLAGSAGVLMALLYPVSPTIATPFLAKAFVIAVLGGLGNMAGALVGGLVLALVETGAAAYIGTSYQLAIGFVIFVLVLVFRPHGLIGKRFYAEI